MIFLFTLYISTPASLLYIIIGLYLANEFLHQNMHHAIVIHCIKGIIFF